MAFDKINTTNATTNILAAAIQDDSKDTLSKLTEAYAYLSPLIGLTRGESLDSEDYADLKEYIGDGVSIMLSDGDCLALTCRDNTVQYGVKAKDSEVTEYHELIDEQGTLTTDELTDISGTYNWTLDESIGSIASQSQTATVFTRLAGMCEKSDVTQADIAAAFSDISGTIPPDVQSLRTSLLNLGAQTSSMSVLTMLQASYSSLSQAKEVNNTIEFAENDFYVKSFCGSVVKNFLVSAVSILGSILIAGGGIVGKIAGVALVGVGFVGNAISTAMNANTGALAKYNPEASQYEYAQRLFKGDVVPAYLDSNIIAAVKEYGVCLIRYPSFNIYVWQNPGDPLYYYEAYASMMLTKIPEYTGGYNPTIPFICGNSSGGVFHVSAAIDCRPPQDIDHPTPGSYCFQDAASYFGDDNGTYRPLLETPSDEEMRRRVTISLIMAAWSLFNIKAYAENKASDSTVQTHGYTVISSNDAYDDVSFILAARINAYFSDNKIMSWQDIVNSFVPALQLLHDSINETPRDLALFKGNSVPGTISLDGSISSCPNFRNSYLITPPEYAPGSIIGAIAAALGAVALVTATFFITKSLVTRKVMRSSTKRFAQVQDSRENWLKSRGTVDEAKNFNKYLRDVRKYNKFANFCGLGTISAVDGYISSGSGSVSSVDNTEFKDLIDNLLRRIVG